MKKTHSANIGGRVFHIDEDAYEKLRGYLQLIEQHFRSYTDAGDIARDIESRVAEQLLQREAASEVVQLADVDRVIAAMGQVEQFGGESEIGAESPRGERRKLFRDPDKRVIAGVAAGIAAYFGVPALAVRIAFIVFLFFFGMAAIVYLLLWFLMPEANSTTEKLQMRGRPLTLSAIEQGVRDSLEDIAPATRNAAVSAVLAAGEFIRLVVGGAARLIKWVAGLFVTGGAAIALLVMTVLLVMALVNASVPPFHPDVSDFFASLGAWRHATKVFLYLIVAIPLALIIILAVKLAWGVRQPNTRSLVALLGIWLVSLLMTAGIWSSHYPELRARMLERSVWYEVRYDDTPRFILPAT